MDRNLFIKYIQNRCTDEELGQVLNWFDAEAGMISGSAFLYKFWKDMGDEVMEMDEHAVNILHRIHHELNRKETERLLQKSGNNLVKFKKRRMIFEALSKIAAVVFLPLLIFSIYMTGNRAFNGSQWIGESRQMYTKIHSPVGSVSQIELLDGTQVWLNQNSTLTYPTIFNKKDIRQVSLSGEAYFQVKHKQKIPFVVSTSDLNIVATGTEFNIMAFPETKRIETTLVNGKVELRKKSVDGKYQTLLELKPSERAIYDTEIEKLDYSATNVDKYILWKEGRLVFINDPLDIVADRLGRFYNVNIIIRDTILHNYTYTANFADETLQQVMELLKLATPIEYTITARKKLDNGTYSKRKVYIKFAGKKPENQLNN